MKETLKSPQYTTLWEVPHMQFPWMRDAIE